jgi:hypothetical protein
MEQGMSECTRRRKDLFPLLRATAGDKGMGTGAHGRGAMDRGRGQTVGGKVGSGRSETMGTAVGKAAWRSRHAGGALDRIPGGGGPQASLH